MRKGFKKFIAVATAALMTAGALSLAACGTDFVPPTGAPSAGDAVESNGGFVVGKGDYYYFINGIESYTSDNTYGTPVKGGLYRIKKADLAAKNNTAERVIPSIMTSGSYNGGIYIYGDRVYYTTPNVVPDPVSGVLDSSVLRFSSAKLDGTDIKDYFTVSSNSDEYRFVEVSGTVYVLYVDSNDLYSYNTASGEKTLLADNTTSVLFNKQDRTDPTVFFTMSVSENQDSDLDARTFAYNQVYSVKADVTEAPYEYNWDMDYIEEELGGEVPYTNLGTIVLDGVDSQSFASNPDSKFTHSTTAPTSWQGYTYALRSYENGGLYYTVTPAKKGGSSVGSEDNGKLLYLDAAKLGSSWDSVKANDEVGITIDVVADATNLSDTATTSALYYIDKDGAHHYLYVDGSAIFRADVNKTNGSHTGEDMQIADNVSGASLISVDLTSDPAYQYLYFSRSNGSGHSVERAVINGEAVNYQNLPYEDLDNEPYQPVKVLNAEVADSWYQFELIGTDLFFADADSDVASTSFNYITVVSLANSESKLMNNKELKAFTDKFNSIMSTDAKVGLLSKLSANSNSKLSTALRYYFLTGETEQFTENINFAVENDKSYTYLYTDEEQSAFEAFTGLADGRGYEDLFSATDFFDGETSYRTYAYFATRIGEVTEADTEKVDDYWKTTLANFALPSEEEGETGLPAWAWALIGIAIAVVVVGCVLVTVFVLRKKNGSEEPKEERMAVDTTDDADVDVYATDESEEGSIEEYEEEPVEEPTEGSSEELAENPEAESEGNEAPEEPAPSEPQE